jgi:hypothetical protein
MTARVLTVLAVLAVAAAAVASVVTAGPAPPPAAPVPTLPTEVRLCERPADEAMLLGCVEGTAAPRLATPELRGAPWIYVGPGGRQGRMSTAPSRPSLEFPPGVTYAEALNELFLWATLVGTLPPQATVAPPLPDGAVLLRPDDPAEGIAVDLRAPWGWEPSVDGVILGPSLTSAPGIPAQARPGELWGRGQRVDVPTLPACQVVSSRDKAPLPCTEGPISRGVPAAPALPVVRTDEPAPAGPRLAYAGGPRCTFRPGRDGAGRAVIVEADYVNQGRAGRGRFTGAVELAGSGRTVRRTVARDVAAGEELTVRVVVPLAPGDRIHLADGRPECSVDAAP